MAIAKLKKKINKLPKKSSFTHYRFSKANLTVFAIIFAAIGGYLIYSSFAAGNIYYIAANGSDSNSGTSKTSPWLHAPGMAGCTGNCATKTPQPGDQFIFRGGDIWYQSGSGTPSGLTWTWNWSGTSINRIYVGVDKTWYTGSSWSRPILNGGNPTSTSAVSSCTVNDTNRNFVSIESANYLTFDNFEFTGLCWSSIPPFGGATYLSAFAASNVASGANLIVSNNYFHGWTHTACGSGCDAMIINGVTYGDQGQGNQYVGNVFDGSDTDGKSMYALYGDCYDFHQNVVRYVANGPVCNNMHTFHDNLFEQVHESFAAPGMHSNTFEFNGEWDGNNYVYNNLIRDNFTASTSGEVNVWVTPNPGRTDYYFNNVVYNIGGDQSGNYWDIENGGNAVFYNNTFQMGGGNFRFQGSRASASFINNHFITSATTLSGLMDNSNGSTISGNNNVFTTKTSATTLGYTAGNSYAPTAGSNPTIGAGTNATSTCTSVGTALCSDTSLGVGYDPTDHLVIIPGRTANTRPATGAWDAGAYQYSSTPTPPPPPDTTAPTVSVTAPSAGVTVSGSNVAVSANASDNVGVAGVQFKLDGNNLDSEDTSSPYSITWDSTLVANGTHTLSAIARDAAGNTTTSSSVSITVSNAAQFSCSGSTATICEDFLGGAGNFTTSGGTWGISGGKYNLTNPITSSSGPVPWNKALHNTTVASDFTLTVDGSVADSSSTFDDFGVVFNYQDANNYYFASFNEGNDTTSNGLFKVVAGTSTELADFASTIAPGTTYSVKVEKTGSTIKISRDSTLLATVTDSSFSSGKVGLASANDSATFDNLVVTTSTSSSKIGDINKDGNVDIFDLSILLSNYNTSTASCDLNTDSTVNIFDLSILLSNYGA